MKSSKPGQPGIYVEILIRQDLARVWELTQEPHLHERWDMRFTHITYLPRPNRDEPQRFLYETRIGFGLRIAGTGESMGEHSADGAATTSSLKFASNDWRSLIRSGSGYWKYIPTEDGLRFFTWYDYEVRFGALGRLIDRIAFRPLIGWATALSFDRLRMWAEAEQSPESSTALLTIYAIARLSVAFVWIWHGLVPKLLYGHIDERTMLTQSGLPVSLLPWLGAAEILFGVVILLKWHNRALLLASAGLMVAALLAVAVKAPVYLTAAFNPVTLNLLVAALSTAGWVAGRNLASARRCLRVDPKRNQEMPA